MLALSVMSLSLCVAQLRAQGKRKEKRMLPKGTSEYQASWILDEGEEEEEEEEGESEEEYYQDSEDDDCDTGSFVSNSNIIMIILTLKGRL